MAVKSETLKLRIDKETKDKAVQAASIEERTVSDYLYRLIKRDLKEKGLN